MRTFLLLTAAMFFVALLMDVCASRGASAPETMQPSHLTLENLKRAEYLVQGETEGKACAKIISLAPLPIWWVTVEREPDNPDGETDFAMWGVRVEGRARDEAEYQALGKAWRADSMMARREHVKEKSALPWYQRSCVTVRGKAIRILPDKKGSEQMLFDEKPGRGEKAEKPVEKPVEKPPAEE